MNKGSKIILILLIIIIAIVAGFFIWKNGETKQNISNNTIGNTNNTNATVKNISNDVANANTIVNNATPNETINIKQILLDVMNNKQKFVDEDNKEVYLKDFKIIENQTAEVDKYAFVDMDNDGVDELVIYTTSDYGAYVILHYEDSKVYGYMIEVRSLENLKEDGSFIGSSGANSTEYLRMTFNKNSYTVKTEAIYDGIDKVYKINNSNVSEKEINEYAENWNKKENVKWSK